MSQYLTNQVRDLAELHCARIKRPCSLGEICDEIEGGEYCADAMLAHLLLWVSKLDEHESHNGKKSPK